MNEHAAGTPPAEPASTAPQPAPLRQAVWRCPVVLLVAAGAVVVSLMFWSGAPVQWAFSGPGNEVWQPWRYLTSCLPHANLVHLLFNLTWWLPLGVAAERAWGGLRLLGACLVLAVMSGLAESACGAGGIGLSGVVYGLCTMLYVVGRSDPRLSGVVTGKTLRLFAAWFVVCIVLTLTGVMPIGNAAHAGGAMGGLLLGAWRSGWRLPRWVWAGATCAILGAVWLLAHSGLVPAIPGFTPKGSVQTDLYCLMMAGRDADAARLVEKNAPVTDPYVAHQYAVALQRLGRKKEALEAYKASARLDPQNEPNERPQMVGLCYALSRDAFDAGDMQAAIASAREGIALAGEATEAHPGYCWFSLGKAQQALGRHADAIDSYRKARSLEPSFAELVGPSIASLLDALGHARLDAEDYLGARAFLDQSVAEYQSVRGAGMTAADADAALVSLYATVAACANGAGDYADAESLARNGIRVSAGLGKSTVAYCWYQLGIALQHAERLPEAEQAYRTAAALDAGLRTDLAKAIASLLDHRAHEMITDGNKQAALPLLQEALEWDPDDQYARELLEAEGVTVGGT